MVKTTLFIIRRKIMDFLGKWIVKKTMFPTEDGIKHLTKDELLALGVDEDLEMFDSVILVKDGGIMEMLVQIPADQVEAAKAEGEAEGWRE